MIYLFLKFQGTIIFLSSSPDSLCRRIDGSPETFLRRPISIHDVDYERNSIKLLVQIAGKGTEKLSMLKTGEKLNIIYPLAIPSVMPDENEHILLVGEDAVLLLYCFLAKY